MSEEDITDPKEMDVMWELEEILISKDLDEDGLSYKDKINLIDSFYDVLLGRMKNAYPKATEAQIIEAIELLRKKGRKP